MNEKFIEENYDTQNTKNEQQKDLCITSEQLTEQWKDGKLSAGWYYIKIADIVFIDFFEGKVWKNKKNEYIDEVLALVPTFEEWQASYNCMLENEVLRLKNAQLKELLKECLAHLTIGKYDIIVTPINILCDEVEEALK